MMITFGTATADGTILQISLADNVSEPSQIAKCAKDYFKIKPELRFKKVKIVATAGESFEESVPHNEENLEDGTFGRTGRDTK